jgi:hypothetical protein
VSTVDDAAEARRLLDVAATDPSENWPLQTGEHTADILAAAQVHATLAVAEQLRLANLIAVSSESSPRRKAEIRVHVGTALRLDEVERFND